MSQIFGEFIEEFPLEHEALELSFTSGFKLTNRQWRNNRLAAYFLADYFLNFLSIDENDPDKDNRMQECKNSISYVGNELLENAIKFNEKSKNHQIKFGIYYLEDIDQVNAVIFTRNSINNHQFSQFQTLIKELLSADTHELYIQQIEKTAADEDSETSGLGLLTIINDYSAKLGWKFDSQPSNPEIMTVTTMAKIIV